jgi:hypothetical protein
MESSDQGAGIARSGRDHKCPNCGANNRADSQWCWQCLERFPEPAEDSPPLATDTDPEGAEEEAAAAESLVGRSSVRREAMSELAGIAGDEEVAARFSGLLGDDTPLAPLTDDSDPRTNGDRSVNGQTAAATTVKEPEVEAVIEGERGAIEIKGRAITWTCSRCDTVNGFERNVCDVCGATFAEILKEPDEKKPQRDPNTVALVSLFFPGAGHAYLGMWGQAVARGVISLWVVATAIFAAAQGATQSLIIAVVFGLMSFGLWAVSAHDAYREARGEKSSVLLRDKMFLYVVLGLLLLSVMMVFSLAMGARG